MAKKTQRERYEEMVAAAIIRQDQCFIHLNEGHTVKEIGEILQISPARVYQLLAKAKARRSKDKL